MANQSDGGIAWLLSQEWIAYAIFAYCLVAFVAGIAVAWYMSEDDDLWTPWYKPMWAWPIVLLVVVLGLLVVTGIESETDHD